MHTLPILSFSILAILSTLCTAAAIQSNHSLSDFTSYSCYPNQPFQLTRNGAPWNCAKALLDRFDSSSQVGDFHTGGEPDAFQL